MYDYRDMTEEEKHEVLEQRRQKGYPLHAPPHQKKNFDCYHVWNSCVNHQHIFEHPSDLTFLEKNLLEGLDEFDISCHAFVFLPNHYHVLVEIKSFDKLSEMLRIRQSKISLGINRRQETKGRTVWNRYGERGIRNSDHYWNVVNYIHFNPVLHEFVDCVDEWPWSSFSQYIEEYGREKMKRIWTCYPVEEFMEEKSLEEI